MMIALPGFEIVTLLKAGVKAVIYRGIRVKDQCPVIIKGLPPEQCTPNNIEQLKHEYAIAQRLNSAAALIVYALEMHQGIPYLIMEDFQARSLDQLLDQFQQPVPFLKIAIEITSKLAQIHTHNIVHKDIKPQNILVNLETNQVKIADFGIAAFIPYQEQIVSSSSGIEGSLAYLSPEQTGRMNQGIDYRSDLYSLGITFYEMLTGQLPFQGKDPLEWVHCHLAKSPLSPIKLKPDIPQMLCDIIMKLLSKVAEQRYQSALGLQFDLEQCLQQLETTGQIQSFVLGEQDISESLQIHRSARIQLIQEQTARQEAEAERQRARFLAQVSATLASSLDYESTLASVANLVVPDFADWCSVDLLQDNQSINRVAVAHRDPEKVKLGWELHQYYPRKLDEPEGVPKVLRTGLAEMLTEIPDAALVEGIADREHLKIVRELGLKSCIILPLMAREIIFGAISFVTAESERHYSTADLSLAEDVAHRAAIAIDNARLYQEAQQAQRIAERALERIARLQSITAALSESLTPAQVSEVIVEQSMAGLGASCALVALLNEAKTELEIVRAVGYNQDLIDSWRHFAIDSPSPLAEAVRTGKPIWAETTENRVNRYPHLTKMYAQYDFEAWISIPLMVEGWAVGGISLGFTQPQQLSGEDQAFILAVAQQCAQAIARAHLYEAQQTARKAAESANRIKDEFLAVLSHELRTPLNPILGWTKLMRTRKLDQVTSDRALETIERNAKLQTQLIEDLLDVSRILQGKLHLNFDRINLVSVIEAAIETVRLSAQAKSIQIQTILESGVGEVLGDANRLQQVIWNILSNAIKFTPSGGQVKIKLGQVGSQIQIRVTDTGKGIAPEFLPYVFDYFRQADGATTRKFGGLGLGLAIVRHLVELHGGTVQAESLGEGQGATFTVRLPYLQDESKGIKDAKDNSLLVAVQSSPLSGLEILVVDDDADMREFLPFMLEQYGATVTVVTSAIEALTALSQSQPNLIISDIGMPEMDGYMLMRQIRSLKPEQGGTIPAIALTAYAGEMDRQQAIAVGFQQHISKPVDPEELVKAIASLVPDLA
ncbi:protein kinase domain-containing protein [Nostoc sp. ChiQUE01b]|uniref:protein kinase domain-containing protein n=1 Tax=Nostoc sp. ChiQUE01b TaxID=3075376 RepID=UPI002AD5958C|nr:ATP-binding protein [Nostoc sp. ChiQUE01b]MDZ8263825.1 ATP-binding protein [Nostoc sp. ChiQUE01b]